MSGQRIGQLRVAMARKGGGSGTGPTNPAVPTLSAPSANANIFNGVAVTLTATSTDVNLDQMAWVLDPAGANTVVAAVLGVGTPAGTFSTTWTPTGVSDGFHVLVARATRSGQSTDSAPNSILVSEIIFALISSRTVLRAWQAESGMAYGAIPRASGAVTPPVLTISGTVAGPVALRVEITGAGALGAAIMRYSAQNTGSGSFGAYIESGVVIPVGGVYALQGALTGMTATFAVGAYATDNVYQGTCSSWTDMKSGATAVQATAANQPRVLVDAAGRVQLHFDGQQWLLDASFTVSQPGTTPIFNWGVWQRDAWTLNHGIWGCGGGGTNGELQLTDRSATPSVQMFCAGLANINAGAASGARVRSESLFTSTASDRLKLGSTLSGGVSAGNGVAGMAGMVIGASTAATTFAMNGAISDFIVCTGGDLTGPELAALNTVAINMRTGVVT